MDIGDFIKREMGPPDHRALRVVARGPDLASLMLGDESFKGSLRIVVLDLEEELAKKLGGHFGTFLKRTRSDVSLLSQASVANALVALFRARHLKPAYLALRADRLERLVGGSLFAEGARTAQGADLPAGLPIHLLQRSRELANKMRADSVFADAASAEIEGADRAMLDEIQLAFRRFTQTRGLDISRLGRDRLVEAFGIFFYSAGIAGTVFNFTTVPRSRMAPILVVLGVVGSLLVPEFGPAYWLAAVVVWVGSTMWFKSRFRTTWAMFLALVACAGALGSLMAFRAAAPDMGWRDRTDRPRSSIREPLGGIAPS